jgi:SNF2 family DNA or RNA helicase
MSEAAPEPVRLSIEGDEIRVQGGGRDLARRRARLYLRSILGGRPDGDAWVVPARRRDPEVLLLAIHRWFHDQGAPLVLEGAASAAVEREVERQRSLARAREAGEAEKRHTGSIDLVAAEEMLLQAGWNAERVLRPHQRAGLAHALAAANSANFSVPGSGKTTTALAAYGVHLTAGIVEFCVVVGPLSSFKPWESETALAFPGSVRARRVRGTAAQRARVYRTVRPRDILLLSYATAAADEQRLREALEARAGFLIVDESHRIKRFEGGVWAPSLVALAQSARVRMILSGTPMPNSAKDLYSQLNVLWPNEILTGTRGAFSLRAENDFDGLLAQVGPFISRTPKEALGLDAYDLKKHDVPMNGVQAEIYEVLRDRFRRQLKDAESWSEKIEILRKARPIRLLQAASNPAVLNKRDSDLDLPALEDEPRSLMERLHVYGDLEQPAKHVVALDLIRALLPSGGKAVVWSTFLYNLDLFSALVRSELGVPVFQVDGRVPLGDSPEDDEPDLRDNPEDLDFREERISAFLAAEGTSVLVANPASCSESISLHSRCHNAIYLDRTYDCALFLQSIDRIHRLGLEPGTKVEVHILQSTLSGQPTIDHVVDTSLLAKEARMKQLLEGAELRPIGLPNVASRASEGATEDLEITLRYLLGEDIG